MYVCVSISLSLYMYIYIYIVFIAEVAGAVAGAVADVLHCTILYIYIHIGR